MAGNEGEEAASQKKAEEMENETFWPIPPILPWISAEGRVVERVEAVVVGDHDVCVLVEEQGKHVVALLGDGVVKRRVTFGILHRKELHF